MKDKYHKFVFCLKFLLGLLSLSLLTIVLILILTLRIPVFGVDFSAFKLVLVTILIPIFIIIAFLTALTINDYRSYLSRRSYFKIGRSFLSFDDIFENENRINIINHILETPGIHHNELLRRCDLKKGQLQWHIDVLIKYNIIKKEKYGQYTIYFPITTSFDANDYLENLFQKSKTTSEILTIIKENPGINSSEISRILNLSRNTIKYHIDKLAKEKLVSQNKKGRKKELYPIYD
ncbi:MAG: winged helix-turn-helix transcriptional regulator [Promethearchaeota archaeon]|jgi:predicted transcriptional regulator